ncbi:hypothetical protein ADK88_25040 [Streptomyces sp. NRRL F-2295]|nr:hypothetical protein ADK88_25040 [Streptomyces sp. NRRL F-2295]
MSGADCVRGNSSCGRTRIRAVRRSVRSWITRGLLALYGSAEEQRQRFAEFARHVVEDKGGEDGSDGQAM